MTISVLTDENDIGPQEPRRTLRYTYPEGWVVAPRFLFGLPRNAPLDRPPVYWPEGLPILMAGPALGNPQRMYLVPSYIVDFARMLPSAFLPRMLDYLAEHGREVYDFLLVEGGLRMAQEYLAAGAGCPTGYVPTRLGRPRF